MFIINFLFFIALFYVGYQQFNLWNLEMERMEFIRFNDELLVKYYIHKLKENISVVNDKFIDINYKNITFLTARFKNSTCNLNI